MLMKWDRNYTKHLETEGLQPANSLYHDFINGQFRGINILPLLAELSVRKWHTNNKAWNEFGSYPQVGTKSENDAPMTNSDTEQRRAE